jgi:hypothetical protein
VRKFVLVDELHLRLSVPRDLPTRAGNAVRRVVDGKQFQVQLGRAVRAVIRETAGLGHVELRITK